MFVWDAPSKAGEYRSPAHASNRYILSVLQSGKVIARLVTIPEGMPSTLVYEKLMAAKYLTGDVRVPLEGTVLPDSYRYDRGERQQAVMDRIQGALNKTMTERSPRSNKVAVAKPPNAAITPTHSGKKET